MLFPSYGKIAAATSGLALAGLMSIAPASAAFRPHVDAAFAPPVTHVQYYGGPHYGYDRHGYGRRPHCYMQSFVRHTPYGRQVVNRRVCR